MSTPRYFSIRELAEAIRQAANFFEWELDTIIEFHAYGQRFGCDPGANVYTFVLEDALRSRGLTPEQFRAEQRQARQPAADGAEGGSHG